MLFWKLGAFRPAQAYLSVQILGLSLFVPQATPQVVCLLSVLRCSWNPSHQCLRLSHGFGAAPWGPCCLELRGPFTPAQAFEAEVMQLSTAL